MRGNPDADGNHNSSPSRKTLQSGVFARSSKPLFRFGTEKSPAGLEFKFNLFGNLFCGTAIGKLAARRNVG